MDNRDIAKKLRQFARRLDNDEDNLYRIKAYRRAAETVLRLDTPVTSLIQQRGIKGLQELPGVGRRLSVTIKKLADI